MPNRKGKARNRGIRRKQSKGKGKAKIAPYPETGNSSEDLLTLAQDSQQAASQQNILLALESSREKEPPEGTSSKGKEVIYASQEDIQMSTPSPPSQQAAPIEEQEQDILTETKRDKGKGKQKAVFETESSSSSSSPLPESGSGSESESEYASSSEYEQDWMSEDDDDEDMPDAGIFEGEAGAGPSEAEAEAPEAPEAGPSSQSHKRQKMDASADEGEGEAEPPQQQRKFYAYSWDVQLDYPGSSPTYSSSDKKISTVNPPPFPPPPPSPIPSQQARGYRNKITSPPAQLARVLAHMRPLLTTLEAATPSPVSRATPLTSPHPLYLACIRADESGILELLHGDWVSSMPEALRSLYNVLVIAPTRFRGNWPVGPEEFGVFEGECSRCGKCREGRAEGRWYRVIVRAFYAEESGRDWGRAVEEREVLWGD
ncbi:hypothetical protein BDV97DRAFT_366768 [Delphinella strobiligena]|nr:hypothetical protein BDV97DRAFT_366768 [Delphinella strobiligena]